MSAAQLGVIFDLDGTLADTLADITSCVNAALEAHRLPPVDSSLVRPLVSYGATQVLRAAAGREADAPVDDLLAVYREHYSRRMFEQTRLYPGWPEALNTLARRVTPMGVLSNKPHPLTLLFGERLLRAWPFVEIVGASPEYPGKPDPARALRMAKRMGCKPRVIRFIGDSPVDMETARRAGMQAIGVTWGFHDAEELRAAGATHILDNPTDLPPMLR